MAPPQILGTTTKTKQQHNNNNNNKTTTTTFVVVVVVLLALEQFIRKKNMKHKIYSPLLYYFGNTNNMEMHQIFLFHALLSLKKMFNLIFSMLIHILCHMLCIL